MWDWYLYSFGKLSASKRSNIKYKKSGIYLISLYTRALNFELPSNRSISITYIWKKYTKHIILQLLLYYTKKSWNKLIHVNPRNFASKIRKSVFKSWQRWQQRWTSRTGLCSRRPRSPWTRARPSCAWTPTEPPFVGSPSRSATTPTLCSSSSRWTSSATRRRCGPSPASCHSLRRITLR